MPLDLSDEDRQQLAKDVAQELDTGTYGNRVLATKRQLLAAVAGGATGVAVLTRLGIDPATAQQAAGQVGTPSSPEDAYLAAVEAQSVSTADRESGILSTMGQNANSGEQLVLGPFGFEESYDNPPSVQVTMMHSFGSDGGQHFLTTAGDVSASEFSVYVINQDSTQRTTGDVAYWAASVDE
jgi:hypothetical protein